MKNLLLSLTLLLSLIVTTLNAQTVSHFEITNSCNTPHTFFNFWIHISGTNASQCTALGAVNFTWHGNTYTTSLTVTGGVCKKARTFSDCSGGNPTLTFPATIVINSPAAIAGTYDVDASGTILLPVELVSFTTKQDNQNIQLDWQTASEEINAGFEVQRSKDGKEWEVLDFVEGNGTTLEVQNYVYTDKAPLIGVNYYRLKQIDYDGQFEYSEIENINYELEITTEKLKIFPNPVIDELNIIDGQGQAIIYNLLGQPIKEFSINDTQFSINTDDLPKGQYLLRIVRQDNSVVTKRFMK